MLVLGHVGITLGAAVAVSGVVDSIHPPTTDDTSITNTRSSLFSRPSRWLTTLAAQIDLRFLLLGALLPDIIDKPLGYIFFRDELGSGRTIAHTLLFVVVITLAGLLVYRLQHKNWLLVISAGTLAHLVLDQMWRMPHTLFWPFLNAPFDQQHYLSNQTGNAFSSLSNYAGNIFSSLTTDPATYIPEIIGGLILLWFGWEILKRHQLMPFIKYGRL
jgi:inner membrane protein